MRITAHRTRAALAVAGLTFCVSVVALSTDSTAAPASDIYISEFMASNNAGLTDEAGAFADWIEIRNAGTTVADLAGWQVQDGGANPFTFPTGVTIPAGGYLVIFSGNAVPGGTRLYTGFGLSAGGEALTLRRPDTSVAHAYTPTFPAQTANVSYGINNVGDERFFSTPTPGSANGPGDLLLTGAVTASPARGFYDAPINVTLATPTAGATIRYTTDGSDPTPTTGTVYSGPVPVSSTTTLRAAAFSTGRSPSAIETHTYVFIASVLQQGTGIPGFPNGRMVSTREQTVPEDTAMDPTIVNSAIYGPQLRTALTAIPSISLTGPVSSIFGPNGFYDSDVLESKMSVELLYPGNPAANDQIDGGVESHSHNRLKRAMRVNFRAEYGQSTWVTNLLREAPVNGGSATNQIRTIVLRAGNQRSWTRDHHNPAAATFTEDQLYRDSQVAMTGYGSHGTFVHVYLNGVYWGLYNVAERPDDDFQATYFGGDDESWYFRNHDTATNGDSTRWDYLVNTLTTRDMSVSANYTELQQYLDVQGFADYLILNWWFGMTDWPQNNFYVANRNAVGGDTATPARYFAWDGEYALDKKFNFTHQGAWVHPFFEPGSTNSEILPRLWRMIKANPSFMSMFSERVNLHTGPGGALSDAAVLARFDALNTRVRDAVIGESARWGDALETLGFGTRTRDDDWQREVNVLRALIVGNTARFITALRNAGYYSSVSAPALSPTPGNVSGPTSVSITNPNGSGSIRYTTDGSDPALAGNTAVRTYSGAFTISESTTVRAVVVNGGTTSPATVGTYVLPSVAITEIHYNPIAATAEEIGAGFTDTAMFDWIEITNITAGPLDLAKLAFTTGITASGLTGTLAAGESAVLAANLDYFRQRHGATPRVVGVYAGALSNGGEQLVVQYPLGIPAVDMTYDDAAPWATTPDGFGPSLAVIDPLGNPSSSSNWQASTTPGGTPGAPNDGTPPPPPPTTTTAAPTTTSAATTTTGAATTTAAPTTTTIVSTAGSLALSRNSNRSAAVPLNGSNLTPGESVYIFLDSTEPATNVRFTLNGTTVRTESLAPWDFNGGATTVPATAYVVNLAAGTHTISAILTRPKG